MSVTDLNTADEWESYGQATLAPVLDNAFRTADAHGNPGAHPIYARFATTKRFTPPYVWSGSVLVRERLDDPYIASENRRPPWDWALTFHPMHDSNDINHLVGIGDQRQGAVRVSAEAVVDGIHRYGYRTGLAGRIRADQIDPIDGEWHDFRFEVDSYNEWRGYWDDVLIVQVKELSPPTISAPCQVALRLDFFDAEFADMRITTPQPPPPKGHPVNFVLLEPSTLNRVIDTRNRPHPVAHASHVWDINHPSLPSDAVAVEVSITATGASKAGWLSGWAKGAWPGTVIVSYDSAPITNQVTVGLSAGKLRTRSSSPVHFVIDLVGYYTEATA
jgi:hypothetical protein